MLSAPAVNGWKIFTGIEMEVTTRMCWGQNFLFKNKFSVVLEEEEHCKKKKELAALSGEKGRERKNLFFSFHFFTNWKKERMEETKKGEKRFSVFFSFEAKKNIPTFRLDWLRTGLKPIRNDYFRFSWINIIPRNDNSSERVVA